MADKKIPLYEFITDEEFDINGVIGYALTATPANERPVFLFSKDKEKKEIHFSSDEKRVVTGILIEANKIINRGDYDCIFKPKEIEKMMKLFAKHERFNFINIEHETEFLSGLFTFESWIVGKKDKIHSLIPDATEGSWAASLYVENEAIWKKLKEGKYLGFSIEGMFQPIESKQSKQLFSDDQKISLLRSIAENVELSSDQKRELIEKIMTQ